MLIDLTAADRNSAVRNSHSACLLAVAGQRCFGGDWHVGREGATVTVGGRTTFYRHTFGSLFAALAFDLRIPWQPRTVRMTAAKSRGARKRVNGAIAWTAGAGTLGAVMLVVSGLGWVLLIPAGLLGAGVIGGRVYLRRQGASSLPGLAALRAMSPQDRNRALGRTSQAPAAWPNAGALPSSSPERGH